MCMPPAMLGGVSAYIGSKTAQVKLLEFAAAEHPNIFVAAVHPGMVDTAMFRKSGAQPESVPMDNAGQDLLLTTCPLQFGYLHTSWCGWPVLTPSSYEGD
ncbi:MAG: hypothetical protein Q9192_003244 [Flavoplaca navasiana]